MRALFLTITLLTSLYAGAQSANDKIDVSCEHNPVEKSSPLADIERQAIKTDYALCKTFFPGDSRDNEQTVAAALKDFGQVSKDKTLNAIGDRFPELAPQFDAFNAEITKDDHRSLPSLKAVLDDNPGACSAYFDGGSDVKKVSYACDDTVACGDLHAGADATCHSAFKALAASINIYKASYTKLTAADTLKKLEHLSGDWDSFLAAARSQTLVDIWATSIFEGGQLRKDHLVGPPDRTWILFHPDIVYENLNAAPDGDKAKMGVAIEWLGVNYWRGDNALGVPIGIALASVYADRPQVRDVGHGLMIHLNNKYTIGWAHRDSGNSFYVTIDLLKAIQDNKQALQQYKDQLFSR